MKYPIVLRAVTLAIAAVACSAHAAEPSETSGPYLGASFGGSGFGTQNISAPKAGTDETDRAFKLYGGYQLNENFGVQAGFVRLGRLENTFTVAGTQVKQRVTGRSLYLAGTARLPLEDAFALTGKLGVSSGKTSGINVLASADTLIGSKRSLMVGFGGEYRFSRNLTLTADVESYGKLSNKVSAGALLVGARIGF